MAKNVPDIVTDKALEHQATGNQMSLCAGQPLTRDDAVTNNMLAIVPMTPGDGNDYTIGNGTPDGREVAMAQKTDIPVVNSGTGDHVAVVNATELLDVTTATAQAVTSGNQVTINSWAHTIRDAT